MLIIVCSRDPGTTPPARLAKAKRNVLEKERQHLETPTCAIWSANSRVGATQTACSARRARPIHRHQHRDCVRRRLARAVVRLRYQVRPAQTSPSAVHTILPNAGKARPSAEHPSAEEQQSALRQQPWFFLINTPEVIKTNYVNNSQNRNIIYCVFQGYTAPRTSCQVQQGRAMMHTTCSSCIKK